MVAEIGFAQWQPGKPGMVVLQVVIPKASHGIVHGRINAHRCFIRIFAGDLSYISKRLPYFLPMTSFTQFHDNGLFGSCPVLPASVFPYPQMASLNPGKRPFWWCRHHCPSSHLSLAARDATSGNKVPKMRGIAFRGRLIPFLFRYIGGFTVISFLFGNPICGHRSKAFTHHVSFALMIATDRDTRSGGICVNMGSSKRPLSYGLSRPLQTLLPMAFVLR